MSGIEKKESNCKLIYVRVRITTASLKIIDVFQWRTSQESTCIKRLSQHY